MHSSFRFDVKPLFIIYALYPAVFVLAFALKPFFFMSVWDLVVIVFWACLGTIVSVHITDLVRQYQSEILSWQQFLLYALVLIFTWFLFREYVILVGNAIFSVY